MAVAFNSNYLGVFPDNSGQSIGTHFLVMLGMTQKYLSNYYVNLDIFKEMNWREKKYEIDVNFIRGILGEDGRVSSKLTSSPSSKAQSMPTEKNHSSLFPPVAVWNQILLFALANKIKQMWQLCHE